MPPPVHYPDRNQYAPSLEATHNLAQIFPCAHAYSFYPPINRAGNEKMAFKSRNKHSTINATNRNGNNKIQITGTAMNSNSANGGQIASNRNQPIMQSNNCMKVFYFFGFSL